MTNILFDLDGTLNDSGPGIKNSAIKTLIEMKLKPIPYEKLNFFIGPPLRDCFRMCSVPEDRIEESVPIFRKYYEAGGKYEANIYNGIEEMLSKLNNDGYKLFVCTSKAQFLAKDIISHFKLDKYFKGIYGALMDGSLALKKDIIAKCLEENGHDAIMVGDTYLDINGANANNLRSIGVTYGYGDNDKLIEYKATVIVDTPSEIYGAVKKLTK